MSEIFYREGTEVYAKTEDGESLFICGCDNIEMADIIVSRLMFSEVSIVD